MSTIESAITDHVKNQHTPHMPVLFLGHGSPMNAIEENEFIEGFRTLSQNLPKPSAILCISAHWYTQGTFVTASPRPVTMHDFYGFPKQLFGVEYPANGHPALAGETVDLLRPETVIPDVNRGLDHGAWSVITHLYPKADVPVIQLSIDYTKPAGWHFELAGRLLKLRTKGVLIIGSGNIVHNLSLVDFRNMNTLDYGFDWAFEAREITNQLILSGNFGGLLEYQNLGRSMQLAVPTPDHFLPLMYTLGLRKEQEPIRLFNDKLVAGSLSMTSVMVG
ncbi:MAG: 4,5-DOPA dioxygenase extradiol [Bacteroidales bacterium]|nr:4,5-DOPA dioxygenase extradiol [Bacteroidales bacterium]